MDKREFLEKNLDQINVVISAILGTKVELKIEEKIDYKKETYFNLVDDYDFKEQCGIMKHAFRSVNIFTFNVWWKENEVTMDFHFGYELLNGGTNASHFCTIKVTDDLVQII